MVSFIERLHCIQDSQLGPSGVLYREVPLYTGQPAVSFIERFHCIQDSQLGPSGVLYKEAPLLLFQQSFGYDSNFLYLNTALYAALCILIIGDLAWGQLSMELSL